MEIKYELTLRGRVRIGDMVKGEITYQRKHVQ